MNEEKSLRLFHELIKPHLDFPFLPHQAILVQGQPVTHAVLSLTASSLFTPVSGLSHQMRSAQGSGTGLHLYSCRVIAGHLFDPGVMTSNHPSLPAPR